MARVRILVVDDEPGMLEVCAATLKRLVNAEVVVEQDARRAAERLKSDTFDLLVADIRMPGLGGIDLLRLARERDAGMAVLIITAFPSVDTAVESMRLGAADYLTKPFKPEDLLATVQRLLATHRLRAEHYLLERQVDRTHRLGDLIGKSPPMQEVFETIRRVAETSADVLILGETGTGKELVARYVHQGSVRRERRFVPVDCGAIPEDLLESELFGHERGSFSGAHARSLGLMEFADKGTFFLDEIGELPLRLQAKLLRALQERKLRRVGGKEEISVDVRVVCATARDLQEEVRRHQFRSDLYYRINVARIVVPPLRERVEDIPLLVAAFTRGFARDMQKEVLEIDPEAMEVLCHYEWPGNVRELQNVIKRALTMVRRKVLSVDDLPDELVARAGHLTGRGHDGFFQLRDWHVAKFEREYFFELLTTCRGDVSRAARDAHIPRGTLYRFLKKHDLDPERFRD